MADQSGQKADQSESNTLSLAWPEMRDLLGVSYPEQRKRFEQTVQQTLALPVQQRWAAMATLVEMVKTAKEKTDQFGEILWEAAKNDESWKDLGISQEEFDSQWKNVKKMAQESKSGKERAKVAKDAVIELWGEDVMNSQFGHVDSYNALQKLRKLARTYKLEDAAPRLNTALIDRLNRTGKGRKNARVFTAGDFEQAIRTQPNKYSPQVIKQNGYGLDNYGLLKALDELPPEQGDDAAPIHESEEKEGKGDVITEINDPAEQTVRSIIEWVTDDFEILEETWAPAQRPAPPVPPAPTPLVSESSSLAVPAPATLPQLETPAEQTATLPTEAAAVASTGKALTQPADSAPQPPGQGVSNAPEIVAAVLEALATTTAATTSAVVSPDVLAPETLTTGAPAIQEATALPVDATAVPIVEPTENLAAAVPEPGNNAEGEGKGPDAEMVDAPQDKQESEEPELCILKFRPIATNEVRREYDFGDLRRKLLDDEQIKSWNEHRCLTTHPLEWWRPTSLSKIFSDEIDLFNYHERVDKPEMMTMTYSLGQQALRQDLVVFLLHCVLRPDQKTCMISIPDFARNYDAGEGPNEHRKYFFKRAQYGLHTTLVFKQQNQADNRSGVKPFGIIFAKDGCADEKFNEETWSYSSCLVPVTPGDVPKAEEDVATYNQAARQHSRLLLPKIGMCEEPMELGISGRRIPYVRKLSGMSNISDALVGAADWESAAVVEELNILLGENGEARVKMLADFRKRLAKKVHELWQEIQATERAVYGERSFFKRKEEGQSGRVDSDEDYIRSDDDSGEEDEEDEIDDDA